MQEQEKRIKDQRTIEANRKKLMGLEGKLGCILKYLGEPLIQQDQGDWFHTSHYLEDEEAQDQDWGGTPEEIITQIPTEDWGNMAADECYRSERIQYDTQEIGMIFDGLSRGMNLEIRYLNQEHILTLKYEGELVYKEVAGELEAYVPSSDWEYKVDQLFPFAKKHEVTVVTEAVKKKKERDHTRKFEFLDKLRKKWGV
jgi:hypothetical protein